MVAILTVTLLIIIFGGVTYAFFTANNPEGSTASINSTSGKMTITYADGKSSLLISKEIQPSDRIIIDKTFTLTGTNTTSGLAMPYKVGIKFKNEFSYNQLYYYIKRVSENENITTKLIGEANQTIPGHETETGYTKGTFIKNSDETYLELANGEFKANTNNQTITFNLKIQFPDNNENQDSEKGKSFTGYIIVNNEEETAVDYIVNLYNEDKENNGLMMDDTEDYNIRYSGSNSEVKNYVSFNDELWRIIGIFDVKDSETGEYQKKIKIVRNEPLGNYSWDSSENNLIGSNDWSNSILQKELNDDYLNTNIMENKNWINSYYVSSSKEIIFYQAGIYDYTKAITTNYQKMIEKSMWEIGGGKFTGTLPNNLITKIQYNNEKNIYVDNNSTKYWIGKIGLIYASDYGYASTDTECRNDLRAGLKLNGSTIIYTDSKCKNNNWLFKNMSYWTISHQGTSSSRVFAVLSSGAINNENAFTAHKLYPSAYILPSVKISFGTGDSSSPYKLSL